MNAANLSAETTAQSGTGAPGRESAPVPERLARVRAELTRLGADALIVPSADPHLSEYLPARWQGRAWLSGFTGSVGALALTLERAALFADSRYWAQAEAELDGSGIDLVRLHSSVGVPYADWLARALPHGATVVVDPDVLGLAAAAAIRARLSETGIVLRTDGDPLAAAWTDRPALPGAPVREHRPPHAVRARTGNLAAVRAAMRERGATHHLVSALDDVAWLLNLRGADIEFNPVFLAHVLLGMERATLFVGGGKVDAALAAALAADGVELADYAEAAAALAALPAGASVLLDPKRVTLGFREAIPPHVRAIEATNPATLVKSRKTDAEIGFIRETMVEDGLAMCRFYAAFEASRAAGEAWDECLVHKRLTAERRRSPLFVGPSFATTAGFNANGALPHYRAIPGRQARIEGDGLLLVDSGGQYLGGTTDVTRTWAIGATTPEMRRDSTLALKGLIALSCARFPRGTPAPLLDPIARAPLWAECADYTHGTGHGVGYFLHVHEGPQFLTRMLPEPETGMEPGMVSAIEPGVYRPGRWGVRHENLVLAVPAPDAGFGAFLQFETLTLCPFDARCLEPSLLETRERSWLDAYQAMVRRELGPRLDGAALDWLLARTEPLA